MNLSVERKIKACRSLILAIAIVPGLVLVVTPWPIAIQVYHRPLWTPWQHAAQAPQIYAANRGLLKGGRFSSAHHFGRPLTRGTTSS